MNDNIYRTRTMLASLYIRQWTGRRLDKQVTYEINSAKHADQEAGRYNKRLGPGSYFKAVTAAVNKARQTFYRNTLPWGDEGQRILPVGNYLETIAAFDECRMDFEAAVAQFVDPQNYAKFIVDGRKMLGDMWDANEYPALRELNKRFQIAFSVMPMPAASDFRCDLGEQEVTRIQEQIARRVEDASRAAFRDCFQRLHDTVFRMGERLSNPDSRLRAEIVDNVKELTKLLPRMNFYDDPDLAEAIEDAKKLTQVPIEVLRESQALRETKAKEAETLSNKLKGWL